MSTYGAPIGPTPPVAPGPQTPAKRKGLHPLAIVGIVFGSLLLLCCIGGVAFVLLSGEDDEPSVREEPASTGGTGETSAEPAEGDPDVAGIGDPARDGKFEFIVTDVETGVATVGDDFLGKDAQGQFVLVHVSVENIGDESQLFDGSSQYLFDTEGREHSADGEAAFYVENSESFLNDINPGNTVEGTLVFDIPSDAVPASLELHDSPFSGGVEVKVG